MTISQMQLMNNTVAGFAAASRAIAVRQLAWVTDHPDGDAGAIVLGDGSSFDVLTLAVVAVLDEGATTADVAVVAASLAAHLADTVDAHDASAVSFSATGSVLATNVQAAIAEVALEAVAAESQLSTESGIHVLPADQAGGTTLVTLAKDNVYLKTFECRKDMIVDAISMCSTATVSAGLTVARFCLYHLGRLDTAGANGMSVMPLARSATDTTIFNSANTVYTKAFDTTGGWPASVRLVRGGRYAVGYLIGGTTAPTVVSIVTAIRPQVATSTNLPYPGFRSSGLGTLTEIPSYFAGNATAYDLAAAGIWVHLRALPTTTKARPLWTALLGDSYFSTYGGWFGFGNTQAGSPCLPYWNAGVSGEQLDQMLTRLTAVLASKPDLVVLHGGINDLGNGVSAATIQANITSIVQATVATGARIVVCTPPPSTAMNAGELVTLGTVRTWIAANVPGLGGVVADTGIALTTGDGVTANAALYTDGVHPTAAGQQAMADVLDGVLAAL